MTTEYCDVTSSYVWVYIGVYRRTHTVTRALVSHVFTVDFIITSLMSADELARLTPEVPGALTYSCCSSCIQTHNADFNRKFHTYLSWLDQHYDQQFLHYRQRHSILTNIVRTRS